MRGEVEHADEITPKDKNQTVALDFMTSLMRQDIKAFTDLWTDNAILDNPFENLMDVHDIDEVWECKEKVLEDYNESIPVRPTIYLKCRP